MNSSGGADLFSEILSERGRLYHSAEEEEEAEIFFNSCH